MNKIQRIVVLLALGIITAMVLFPPRLITYSPKSHKPEVRYVSIFAPVTGKTGKTVISSIFVSSDPQGEFKELIKLGLIPAYETKETAIDEEYQIEEIEFGRLLLQILAVSLITAGIAIATSKSRNSGGNPV